MREQEKPYLIEDLVEMARRGRAAEAVGVLENAVARLEAAHGAGSFEVASARGDLGQLYLLLGDTGRAVEQLRLALECELDPRSERRRHLITLGSVLAEALEKDGQTALAEQSHAENLKKRAEFYGEDHAGYGFGLAWYAEFLARKSDDRAIQIAQEAFQTLQKSRHPRMAEVLVLLARLQLRAGQEHPFSSLDLGEELWDLVGQAMNSGLSDFSFEILLESIDSYLRVDQELLGPRAPGRRAAHEAGFFIARGSGHLAYMHIHAEVLRAWSRADDDPKGELWATLEMSFAAEKMGNIAEAEALLKDGLRLANDLGDDKIRCHTLRQYGVFLAQQKRPDAGMVLQNALLEALVLEDPAELARTRTALGIHLQHEGKLEEARALFREAMAVFEPDDPGALSARSHLDAIENNGSCGCGDGARAMASALVDLLRPELPEGLLDDVVLHEGQLCPRLTRNPTREEEIVLLQAWAQAFSRLNQARF